jgi:polyisoprenoid-binding protein YceI
MLKSRTQRIIAAAVVLVVVVGFAGWWFVLRDDAPEEASIDDASETLEQASGDDASETGGDADSVEGTWTVDPSVGSFDDFSGTYAGYRVEEELAGIGATTAVGRTPDVTGEITIEGDQVTAGSFEVDMTTLQSDQDRRDNAIRGRGLETDAFPTATFEITEPVELPEGIATAGGSVPFVATGDLTLHGVTNEVTVDFDAEVANGTIAIVGQAPISLPDYDIEAPTNAVALSIDDNGTLEFQLFLSRS